ncbi:MAG: hypothetical protein AB7D96_04215 [Arcobacteraceae bacterium]
MIFIGDNLIPFGEIQRVSTISAISQTKPNSTVLFDYDEVLMKYCFENQIAYAAKVQSLKEAIYANALRAKYIICPKDIASVVQKSAQNYLFDSKILAVITSNDEIEEIAQLEIDGAIYESVLV